MAYDGYVEFDNAELFNVARTYLLSRANGVGTVRILGRVLDWLKDDLGFGLTGFGLGGFGLGGFGIGSPDDWADITLAPWYDSGVVASGEFFGLVPLSINGLDDSSLESTPVEYITDGGNSGRPRNATQPLVFNVGIIASTERGAEYGKRWLDRRLRGSGSPIFCSGAELHYFRYAGEAGDTGVPRVHRRDVRLTRGTSVTRKKRGWCSVTWLVTFTLTAADPFEYGMTIPAVTEMGDETPTGPLVDDSDSLVLVQSSCPAYDYTPIYDPFYPALVPPPPLPNVTPAGWNIESGMTFERFWVQLDQVEPSALFVVPVLTLTTDEDARMVRFSVWPSSANEYDQCDPLWSAVVSYLPAGFEFVIDGERKASYVWDGFSASVRRADSLVYSPDASPVRWPSFNDPGKMQVTLDIFTDSDGYEGGGSVRAALDFIPKSD